MISTYDTRLDVFTKCICFEWYSLTDLIKSSTFLLTWILLTVVLEKTFLQIFTEWVKLLSKTLLWDYKYQALTKDHLKKAAFNSQVLSTHFHPKCPYYLHLTWVLQHCFTWTITLVKLNKKITSRKSLQLEIFSTILYPKDCSPWTQNSSAENFHWNILILLINYLLF